MARFAGSPSVDFPRRQLLTALATLPALALGACGSESSGAKNPDGTAPASDLERLLAAVRSSPDHLAARADEAVASKNVEQIARFVRENISVLPPLDARARAEDFTVWGPRGTLRGGAGVLRDRAELLVQLLGDAGFDAKLVSMSRPGAFDEAALYADKRKAFAPARAALSELAAKQGLELPKAADDTPTAARVQQLSQALLAALPEAARTASSTAPPLPDTLPIVEVTDGGKKAWAVALGELDVVREEPAGLSSLGDATPANVDVTVSVALNPPRGVEADASVLHDVLTASWQSNDLAGRQLLLAFPPPGGAEALLGYDTQAAPVRLPTLRLISTDKLGQDVLDSAIGQPLLLAGAVLDVSGEGADTAIASPLGSAPSLDDAQRKKRRAAVASLSVDVNAAAFSSVELALQLADADGAPVDGLTAADFVVEEDGAAQAIELYANTVPAKLRLLVVYDTSGSVADFWKTPAERSAFESSLADALVSATTSSPFEVQVVAVGNAAASDAWTEPDAKALRAAFAASSGQFSSIWETVGAIVPASGANAALLLSDEASSLEDPSQIESWKRALSASGIPIGVVPIGTAIDAAAVDEIVTGSGGAVLDPSAATFGDDLSGFVTEKLDSARATNYRLRYRAPEAGATKRKVHVSLIDTNAVAADSTYTVPAEAERATPSGIAGVYVTLRVGGVTTRRRLGGVAVSPRGAVAKPSAEMLDDAASALSGVHTLVFEPSAPTAAHLLDDAITSLLSQQKLIPASKAGTAELLAALPEAQPFPLPLAALFDDAPLELGDVALGGGLRALVLSVVERAGTVTLQSDIVPELNVWGGIGEASARFEAALSRSLLLSLRESQLMKTAAAAALDGQTLFAVVPGSSTLPANWDDATRARFAELLASYDQWLRLVPEDGSQTALWVIDPATGSATAVGTSGKGMGSSNCDEIGDLQNALSLASALVTMHCTLLSSDSIACVGSNVYSAATAAWGSFTHPVSFNLVIGDIATAVGFLSGPAGFAPGAAGSRIVLAVIQLMLNALSIITNC